MVKIACSSGIRSTQSLEKACRLIRELGFSRVDPLAMEQWHIKPSLIVEDPNREAAWASAVLERNQLQCAALNLGFLHNLTTCSQQEHRANLELVSGACILARSLGTGVITVGSGTFQGGERRQVVDRVVERLRDVVSVVSGAGVVVALETHAGSIAVYPEASREILSRCPGLKLTYDPSHYVAEKIPLHETLDLLAHAAHIHLRNARVGHFQERMALGLLDLPWMVDQILAAGYRDAASIEYIEDCGATEEGYSAEEEALTLCQILLDKGLSL